MAVPRLEVLQRSPPAEPSIPDLLNQAERQRQEAIRLLAAKYEMGDSVVEQLLTTDIPQGKEMQQELAEIINRLNSD